MRILVVDRDSYLAEEIEKSYLVDAASDGNEGVCLSHDNDYDAIVVGPTLLGIEALDFCKTAREAQVKAPILFISHEHRTNALDFGADVCTKPPVEPEELKAQLRALIRRGSDLNFISIIKSGKLEVNFKERTVLWKGKEISLRRKEYDLIEYLAFHKGKVISKENILEHVWEVGLYVYSNSVEVHVRNIRRKFGAKIIKTVRGFGYMIGS